MIKCGVTGVGDALLEEASFAQERSERYAAEYESLMARVNAMSESAVQSSVVNSLNARWNIKSEHDSVADADVAHDAWHSRYHGTAKDQVAHEHMHEAQAEDAEMKRERACEAVTLAESELAALQDQA